MSTRPRQNASKPRTPAPGLTLPLALVATILWAVALFLSAVSGLSENQTPQQVAHLNHVVRAQFVLASVGVISAWLAHIWARQGHSRHATVAALLVLPCFVAAAIVVATA